MHSIAVQMLYIFCQVVVTVTFSDYGHFTLLGLLARAFAKGQCRFYCAVKSLHFKRCCILVWSSVRPLDPVGALPRGRRSRHCRTGNISVTLVNATTQGVHQLCKADWNQGQDRAICSCTVTYKTSLSASAVGVWLPNSKRNFNYLSGDVEAKTCRKTIWSVKLLCYKFVFVVNQSRTPVVLSYKLVFVVKSIMVIWTRLACVPISRSNWGSHLLTV